jgi:SAM-dependent methyltransferase
MSRRWDERYAEPGWAYGTEPNDFLREVAPRLPRGRTLCLADGEGRNGVHLATIGHEVVSMDFSTIGLAKAERLAAERGVRIATVQGDLARFPIAPGAWDAIVSIFVHQPTAIRAPLYRAVVGGLRPGGAFVLESYGPEQIGRGGGGPDDPDQEPPLATLRAELEGLEWEIAREIEREVIEGRFHDGSAAVVQMLGWKRG